MVSGPARGLGRAIAERLRADGFGLSLGGRDPDALGELVTGGTDPVDVDDVDGGDGRARVTAHRFDATDGDTARRWVAETIDRHGRIDGLVNNAGLLDTFGLDAYDEAAFDAMWEVNVKAPTLLTHLVLPHLAAAGHGRVVNIASLSGKRVSNGFAPGYAMTKHALVALTHATRHHGWNDGIRATAICPSFVATDMIAGVDTGGRGGHRPGRRRRPGQHRPDPARLGVGGRAHDQLSTGGQLLMPPAPRPEPGPEPRPEPGPDDPPPGGPGPRNLLVILLDSLNRHHLGCYGGTEFDTPNLDRFAARSTRFTNHVTGSLPCMPARHDILVGAIDFLWRCWGSIEIWESSIVADIRAAGVPTVLFTDHPHLFETGGENYHTDFGAWDYLRGHEGDPWRTHGRPVVDRRPDPRGADRPVPSGPPCRTEWLVLEPSVRDRARSAATTTTPGPGSGPRTTSPGRPRWRPRPAGCTVRPPTTTAGSASSTSSIPTSRSTPPSGG